MKLNENNQIEQINLDYVFTNTRKVEKAIPLTSSDVVAQNCKIEHRAAKQLIKKYIDKFNELGNRDKKGNIELMHLKCGGKKGTKNYKTWYELNEQQTNFGKYFWAVSIVSKSGVRHSVVFSTDSEDVLVKN